MADADKNCMFSAVAGTTDYAVTCTEFRALNTNAGCPMWDSTTNSCNMADFFRRQVQLGGRKDAS